MCEGLWMACYRHADIQMQCEVYHSLLILKPDIQVARGLMCVALRPHLRCHPGLSLRPAWHQLLPRRPTGQKCDVGGGRLSVPAVPCAHARARQLDPSHHHPGTSTTHWCWSRRRQSWDRRCMWAGHRQGCCRSPGC